MPYRITHPTPLAWLIGTCLLFVLSGVACVPRSGNDIDYSTYQPASGGKKNTNSVMQTPEFFNR